jgi:hypothetical protein
VDKCAGTRHGGVFSRAPSALRHYMIARRENRGLEDYFPAMLMSEAADWLEKNRESPKP